jgi:lysophospholipase L1-like esterase
MPFALKDGDRFVFMGDSITDCGRREPATPQGTGYAAIAQGLILGQAAALQVEYFNRGIGGDTTAELEKRWQEDVLDLRPTWMSVLIGINDCYQYVSGREEVGPEPYAVRYQALLQRAVDATGCRLVLLEPFLFTTRDRMTDETAVKGWDLLPQYRQTVARLAEQFGATLIRTHEIGQEIIAAHGPEVLWGDPVHPNLTGHALIAWHLVEALRA